MTGKGGNRREGYFVVVAACVPPASARACKILPKVKTLKRKIFFFSSSNEISPKRRRQFICGTQKLSAAHQGNKNYTVSFSKLTD
jgi:hypothetical protein